MRLLTPTATAHTPPTYTHRWFRRRNQSTFETFVAPEWAGKPITYLEIGVFEGQSMVWMLENVLTHRLARAVGIDPWLMMVKQTEEEMDRVRIRALANTARWPNCTLQRGNSADVLRAMIVNRHLGIGRGDVDVCLIDGHHTAYAVTDDASLVYELLKPGGWMIFDDVENARKRENHVLQGMHAFVDRHLGVEFVWKDRFCECYRKSSGNRA
jgi:predicted O-methyltransferase YrrM